MDMEDCRILKINVENAHMKRNIAAYAAAGTLIGILKLMNEWPEVRKALEPYRSSIEKSVNNYRNAEEAMDRAEADYHDSIAAEAETSSFKC